MRRGLRWLGYPASFGAVALLFCAATAYAGVYGRPYFDSGTREDLRLDRRWWLELGALSPAATGRTGDFQMGAGLGAGVELPISSGSAIALRVQSGVLPLRGTSADGDTLHGDSWGLSAASIGLRGRVAPWGRCPTVRVVGELMGGPAMLHFGRTERHAGASQGVAPDLRTKGALLTLGVGLEAQPEESPGLFLAARFEWFSSDQTYTWRAYEAGITFPW